MSSASVNQFIALPGLLLLGGWLVLISPSNPAQAKVISNNILMAQTMVEPLGSPPLISDVSNPQQPLPELQPSSEVPVIEFRQSQPSEVAPAQKYVPQYRRQRYRPSYRPSYSQKIGRYLVYVNDNSPQLLQQVRLIEPKAYIRQFQGRSVIQAGAFTREYNAQQRLAQLRSYGIGRTEIVSDGERIRGSYTDGIPYSYREPTPYPYRGEDDGRNRPKSYYVAIPGNSEQLPAIESRIKQSVGINTGVTTRNNPRGAHVAVGPFAQRLEAEQWNNYLRNQGFSNARVYYGR